MPALVAGIHVSGMQQEKAWMAGTSPAMTGRSRPGALGLGLRLVRVDLLLLDLGEADVVEAVKQAVLAVRIDLELHQAAVGAADLLLREIDRQRRVGAAIGV